MDASGGHVSAPAGVLTVQLRLVCLAEAAPGANAGGGFARAVRRSHRGESNAGRKAHTARPSNRRLPGFGRAVVDVRRKPECRPVWHLRPVRRTAHHVHVRSSVLAVRAGAGGPGRGPGADPRAAGKRLRGCRHGDPPVSARLDPAKSDRARRDSARIRQPRQPKRPGRFSCAGDRAWRRRATDGPVSRVANRVAQSARRVRSRAPAELQPELLAGRGRRHCRCCRQPEEAASSARPAGAGIRGAGAGAGRRLLPRWLRAAGAQSGRPDADGLRSEQDRRIEIRDLDRFGAPDRQPAGAWLRAGQRGSCLPAVSDRRLGPGRLRSPADRQGARGAAAGRSHARNHRLGGVRIPGGCFPAHLLARPEDRSGRPGVCRLDRLRAGGPAELHRARLSPALLDLCGRGDGVV